MQVSYQISLCKKCFLAFSLTSQAAASLACRSRDLATNKLRVKYNHYEIELAEGGLKKPINFSAWFFSALAVEGEVYVFFGPHSTSNK